MQYLGPAPLNDNGSHLMALNRRLRNGSEITQFAAAAPKPARKTQVATVTQKPRLEPESEMIANEDFQPEPQPSGKGNYFVQVGSFADPDNAERARNDVAGTGPVQVEPLESQSGTLYRVRVGPLQDEMQARDALQSIVVVGHTDARLILAQGMM